MNKAQHRYCMFTSIMSMLVYFLICAIHMGIDPEPLFQVHYVLFWVFVSVIWGFWTNPFVKEEPGK